jgi:hypothetical protein
MWPFSKPDPFCAHIIASLAAHPDDWKLVETRTQIGWESCKAGAEEAEKSDETRWNGSTYVALYRRPTWQPALQLVHAGGDITLRDPDATNYAGWVIEKPAHVLTSKVDSKLLSEAVKQWREGRVAVALSTSVADQKQFDEAMRELDTLK